MPVKALLFDFDGTLIDTESAELRAWEEVYAHHGLELSLDDWATGIGTVGGFEPVEHLEATLGRALDDETVTTRRTRMLELVAAEALRPGVEAYLTDAAELGLKVGIVTSSTRTWVLDNLARLALGQTWDCVVCAEFDAARAKPRPDLYVDACRELGVAPAEALAFEDSPNGVAAAREAGIFCVAVPNAVTSRLDLAGADLRLESLEEMPLRELLARAA